MLADRGQNGLQRTGLVRVVDVNGAAGGAGADVFHTTGNTSKARQVGKRARQVGVADARQGKRAQHILGLERPDERKLGFVGGAPYLEAERLPVRRRVLRQEPKVAALPAEHEGLDVAFGASLQKRATLGRIGVQDGGAIGSQELGEQTGLGGEIARHVVVIVQMVLAKVSEERRLG